ncbi:TetR/AcrR family transcriptional regulator [Paraburkholderia phymatum]|uniref:TetR/AcrR family transcriptional regulator n=1 Tax=Paraburkholderia phymatum TaxID=148447 RepID=UPI003170D088
MRKMYVTSEEILGASAAQPARRGNRTTRVPAILEVAISVFATKGNAGFTLRGVATEAGIQLKTLQHYFNTRDELLRATIAEMTRRYIARYTTIAKNKLLSPEARLDTIIDEIFAELTGPRGHIAGGFALECWGLAEHDESTRDFFDKNTSEFHELFVGLVAKLNPTLSAAECAMRGAQLLSHMFGLVVYIRRAGDTCPDRDAFRHVTKVVWKAISNASQ